jgi:hypothetical protein
MVPTLLYQLFPGKTFVISPQDRSIIDSRNYCPFSGGMLNAIHDQYGSYAPIVSLGFPICPPAIFWAIGSIIINSVKG